MENLKSKELEERREKERQILKDLDRDRKIKGLKELRNTNNLYERVINEILEDCKDYTGTLKERIVVRCNEIVEYGCVSGTVASMIYYSDTNKFFNTYYDEIMELIEDLEDDGLEIIECLKRNLTTTQIIMNDEQAKNQIAWLVYEEIANKLLYWVED